MGASYGKLTPGHEEAIYRLRKETNAHGKPRSGSEIRRALAQGVPGEPPVSISADRALKVARRLLDERDELYNSKVQNRPPHEGLAVLTKRLMLIAEREVVRLERAEKAGRLDASRLGKMASALTKLHTLLERAEEAKDDGATDKKGGSSPGGAETVPPSTFADELLEGKENAPTVADEVLPAATNGAPPKLPW